MNTIECDVLIVGGGLVGLSAAIALDCANPPRQTESTKAATSLRILQIEAGAPNTPTSPRWDERNFALARASVNTLSRLGVMLDGLDTSEVASSVPIKSSLPAQARRVDLPNAIRHIHVTQRGNLGSVRFHADDYAVPYLGLCVPARQLAARLEARAQALSNGSRWFHARLLSFQSDDQGDGDGGVNATIEHAGETKVVRCKVLVAADGAQSPIRAQAGIAHESIDYQQTAIVCTVQTSVDANQTAFERFTTEGPVALLPVGPNRMGCIFTVASAKAEATLGLSEADFLAALQERFGWRLGRFERVGERQAWPLNLIKSERLIAPRVVLIGNAAQSIHPIGAQGFNLGLRDATALAEALSAAHGDCGVDAVLKTYAASRASDRNQTMQFSDGLVRMAKHDGLPIRALRSLAFALTEHIAPLKRDLAMRAMGFREAHQDASHTVQPKSVQAKLVQAKLVQR